jgi:hypothetical protein
VSETFKFLASRSMSNNKRLSIMMFKTLVVKPKSALSTSLGLDWPSGVSVENLITIRNTASHSAC